MDLLIQLIEYALWNFVQNLDTVPVKKIEQEI